DMTTATLSTTGLLTAMAQGTTEVTARQNGISSYTFLVTVTDAVLTAIQVTPPSVSVGKGQTQQLTATATYSDNTTANVTGSVAWLSDDMTTATVSTTGLLTGMAQGTTEVTASQNGITSNTVQVTVTDAVLTAIEITPPSVSVGKGQTQQLTTTATYSDNTTANVTGSVAWLSDDTATATITTNGLLTGVEQGTAEVTASLDGMTSNAVQVTVTDAVLTAIAITPPSVSVGKGQTQQLTATATYSDNTTANVTGSVAWLSDDTATATITTNGLLTGVEQGTAEVTASLDGVTSNAVQVTVTDAVLTAIDITPPSVSVDKGQTQQLTATATYSDNTTADVTGSVAWLSDDTATATVISGLLTGVEEGTTEISASLDGVTSNTVHVTVSISSLFGAFEGVSVNGFTFAVDAGFPSTGFDGAEFTLKLPDSPETSSDYIWSGDAAWVSVDNGGTVRFISQGDSSPVTITATPKSGGRPLVYTFAVNSWFHSNGGPNLSQSDARQWCWRELAPGYTWSVPTYPLLNQMPSARGTIGMLWSEWGNMRMYSDSTFTNGFSYWTTSTASTGNYYYVALGQNSGGINWASGSELNAVVCRLEL
ncbi:Ig-like domain-containing protein, partial [Aeromonas caviae]|uniref:Ig-like domain-containing protein n=1 Tax=Aeromonas caviae TaxID=648 RepID=UPI0029DC2BFE